MEPAAPAIAATLGFGFVNAVFAGTFLAHKRLNKWPNVRTGRQILPVRSSTWSTSGD